MSLSITNFSKHFPRIDKRLIQRYPCTEWSLVLSDSGMGITLAFFHFFGKQPSRKHLSKSDIQKVGRLLCSRFTMTPSIPSRPGHFLSSILFINFSTSCFVKIGSVWESGDPSSSICALMFPCCLLSCAVRLSGKNLSRRALTVSFSDVVTDPSGRVSDDSTACLTKPDLQVLYIFQGVILVLSVQNFFQGSCLALRSSGFYCFL